MGYSMGGQVALILASLDNRITEVISIAPPFLNDTTALVAPKNFVSLLKDIPVLLITADDDENSSQEENDYLYNLIPSSKKDRVDFTSGHILPEGYVKKLSSRFTN